MLVGSDLVKIIVGLGNPGKNYEKTRHNVGFYFLDEYLKKNNIVNAKSKFNGIYFEHIINGEKIIFLKPQSYMNLSGEVIKKFVDYFRIDIDNILVVSDDMALSVGNYRLRSSGSCGGHNGLRNIEMTLGTSKFKRLRIGISSAQGCDIKDYVLGKFSNEDLLVYDEMLVLISNIIDDFLIMDFDRLMNKYNRKNR